MIKQRGLRWFVWATSWGLLQWPAYAHASNEDFFDLLGSYAWGLFLILPVPFLIIGTIGFLLYRKTR